ncbi:Canalicular multispecific organic anion transporter 2 [Actinomortierella ambigua]|nr:Canalicular multispecific organic anion transporter 2 [Actinomortierella ambigua]
MTLLSAFAVYSNVSIRSSTETAEGTAQLLTHLKYFTLFIGLGFVVEAFPRSNTRVQQLAREVEKQTIVEQANIGSRLTFHYINYLLRLGTQQAFLDKDIPHLASDNMRSELCSKNLREAWGKARAKYEAKVKANPGKTVRPPSLLWTIFYMEKWRFGAVTVGRIVGIGMSYLMPEILRRILQFIEAASDAHNHPEKYPPNGESPYPLRYGVLLAISMLAIYFASAVVTTWSFHMALVHGMTLRGGLSHLVYLKSLVLSPQARHENTVGSIVNRMSVDADKFSIDYQMLPWLIGCPLEVILGVLMLFKIMGWSALAGVILIAAMTPAQGWMSSLMIHAEDEKLERMDERVRLMTEILAGMKIIKLYGWSESFLNKVIAVRAQEIIALRRLTILRAFINMVFSSWSLMVSLLTFSIYATIGGPGFTPGLMRADIVFASLAVFVKLSGPMGMFSHCWASYVSLKVSTDRVQELLLADEIDENVVQRYPRAAAELDPQTHEPIAIQMKDATMAWTKSVDKDNANDLTKNDAEREPLLASDHSATASDDKPTLKNINVSIIQSSLTAIVGRVGQGKSSFLSAITGEMYKRRGSIKTYGSIAYAPQQAWIIHGTLRDNILFGKPFDQSKYDRIVFAAGLRPDIAMLPAGDQTEIGERGINLSGGQKQRVSLARAAYQDADIYLLDDPLSAVDAHVDQHLWEHLIGPEGLLADKTRVLVTHGVHHLSQTDQIVLLKDGEVSELGHYQELVDARQAFYRLIRDYSVAHKAKDKVKRLKASNQDAAETASQRSVDTGYSEETRLEGAAASDQEGSQSGDTVEGKLQDGALVTEETATFGTASWKMYKRYAKACKYPMVLFIIIMYCVTQACHIVTNLWLRYWIDMDSKDKENGTASNSVAFYLVVYGLMVVVFLVLNVAVNYIAQVITFLGAAVVIHENLLRRVLRLPMSFFDTTPLGRIINRFSSDTGTIDKDLPVEAGEFLGFVTEIIGTFIVVAFSTPAFLIAIPPAIFTYVWIQYYFIMTSGTLKKHYQVSRSPVYSHFSETLLGVSTIRVMTGAKQRFISISESRIDYMTQKYLVFLTCNRWLSFRLEMLGAVLIFAATILAVLSAETMDAAMVGLALSYSLSLTYLINLLVRSAAEIQNCMVNYERVDEYTNKPTEAPTETGVPLPDQWPQAGRVQFQDYSTRYRQDLDLVLRHVSFTVQPGEKVGIVGRTGAGKSSLTLALFRIIEAANSYWAKASEGLLPQDSISDASLPATDATATTFKPLSDDTIDGGAIIIDGVDISTVGLDYLRQHLAIIPQDPTLFAGTVRENLDPFHEWLDADLWEALERAHLKQHIASLNGGLNFEVAQNGDNFSVGQRSLLCLARALLRKTKILVLDEATSSVDMQTDELIQQTIRTEFKDRTILTIAHRIKTVMDYDKILVLDKGQVQEFAPPAELLRRKSSMFYSLAEQAGLIKSSHVA